MPFHALDAGCGRRYSQRCRLAQTSSLRKGRLVRAEAKEEDRDPAPDARPHHFVLKFALV